RVHQPRDRGSLPLRRGTGAPGGAAPHLQRVGHHALRVAVPLPAGPAEPARRSRADRRALRHRRPPQRNAEERVPRWPALGRARRRDGHDRGGRRDRGRAGGGRRSRRRRDGFRFRQSGRAPGRIRRARQSRDRRRRGHAERSHVGPGAGLLRPADRQRLRRQRRVRDQRAGEPVRQQRPHRGAQPGELRAAVHAGRGVARPGTGEIPADRAAARAGARGDRAPAVRAAGIARGSRQHPHDSRAKGRDRPLHRPACRAPPGAARGAARARPRHRATRRRAQGHQHRAGACAPDRVRAGRGLAPQARPPGEERAMSARTLRLLAVAVVVLFAAVWLVDRQRGGGTREDGLLLPGLEARLDEITAVRITDADGEVRIVREDDDWIVPAKGGYPADVAKLRELLLGLAEARRIEQKTANPELYDRLGVQDPEQEGASGKRVASEGLGEADFEVILGDSAQRDYRYARIAGDATSWLIDRNPKLPDDAAGWLVPEITDIPASRVQSVTIRHEGGDTIAIRKADAGDTNFTVDNIPEGRELSYPSVANSIASALDNLNLDDVRRAGEGAADSEGDVEPSRVTTVFRTFDGLEVTVESTGTEDETWIRLAAAAVPAGDAGTSGDAPGPDDGEETS